MSENAARRAARFDTHLLAQGAPEVVAELTSSVATYGVTDLVTWGAAPGLAPELMNGSLERLAGNVPLRVRAGLGWEG
ncbi:MAG: hypothetical protein ACFCVK_21180 [Acidimicrobiales bacterium]